MLLSPSSIAGLCPVCKNVRQHGRSCCTNTYLECMHVPTSTSEYSLSTHVMSVMSFTYITSLVSEFVFSSPYCRTSFLHLHTSTHRDTHSPHTHLYYTHTYNIRLQHTHVHTRMPHTHSSYIRILQTLTSYVHFCLCPTLECG